MTPLGVALIIAIALFPVVGQGRATPAQATEATWDPLRDGGKVAAPRLLPPVGARER